MVNNHPSPRLRVWLLETTAGGQGLVIVNHVNSLYYIIIVSVGCYCTHIVQGFTVIILLDMETML